MVLIEFIKSLPFARLSDYLLTALSHLTINKVFNFVKTEYNCYRRNISCSSFPYLLVIDPVNYCQLRCPLCATGQKLHQKPDRIMDFSTFKKIIDELERYLLMIHLVWWGEPFLNPGLLNFIKYAHKKNVGVQISTNFSFNFNQAQMRDIVKSGLDILVVSLDGSTPDIYNKYRVGGNFSFVTRNVKILAKMKKKLHSSKPKIQLQFLVNKYNEHQVPELNLFAKSLGANSVILEQLLVLCGQNKCDVDLEKWLPVNPRYTPNSTSLKTNKSDNLSQGKCWWLWRDAAISPDGKVSPCCYCDSINSDFGNINKESFAEIWNNKKYQSARSLFRHKKGSPTTVCHKCNIFSPASSPRQKI